MARPLSSKALGLMFDPPVCARQINRLRRRGMPGDLPGALAWRAAHLDCRYTRSPRSARTGADGAEHSTPPGGQGSSLREQLMHARIALLRKQAQSNDGGTTPNDDIARALVAAVQQCIVMTSGCGGSLESHIRTHIGAEAASKAKLRAVCVSWEDGVAAGFENVVVESLAKFAPGVLKSFRRKWPAEDVAE